MISYWVTSEGRFGIDAYRDNRGAPIAHRFATHLYEEVGATVHIDSGAQIFSTLDRVTPGQRAVAEAVWDAHARAAPGAPRLNDPRRVLLRFALLTRLYECGLNGYQVFRARDVGRVSRFPVFIRHMHDHSGPRTRLLQNHQEIRAALLALRVRGHRLRDLMIVEFCDTSDRNGVFRKFSAFRLGNRIMPSHLLVSHHWCVKSGRNEPTEQNIRDGLEYLESNPHRDWLARVFEASGIEYGRVDYGVRDGAPQVWEINLNPTIGRASGWQGRAIQDPRLKSLLEGGRKRFHDRLRAAFLELDSGWDDAAKVSITVDASMLELLAAEAATERRRARVRNTLSGIYHHPRLGIPVRVVARLFPSPRRRGADLRRHDEVS